MVGMHVRLMDVVAVIGSVAALLAALFGFFNGQAIAEIRGRVDEIGGTLMQHVSTPGLHR